MGRGTGNTAQAQITLRTPRASDGPPAWMNTIAVGVAAPSPGGRRDMILALLREAAASGVAIKRLEELGVSWEEFWRHFNSLTADGYLIQAAPTRACLHSEPDEPVDGRQTILRLLREAHDRRCPISEIVAAGVPRMALLNGHWQSLTDEGYVLQQTGQDISLLVDLPGS